jgi:hypothetical protein
MPRRLAIVPLACVALTACRAPPTPRGAGGAASVATASEAASFAGDAGASDAGSRAELLEIFLEAARTNLERPYPASQRGSRARYRDAATSLLGMDRFNHGRSAASHVARVLARVEEDRAHQALMAWAATPAAREHLPDILPRMVERPRAEYLATCKAILQDPTLAEVVLVSFENPAGLLGDALEMEVTMSVHALALGLALSLPGPDGPELVRRYAMDRARSAPDPRTLKALTCAAGQVRVELEAQAAASLRILALSMLGDRALLATVSNDATEPALVRHWARRMLLGRLDRRADPRAQRNYELAMIEYVGPDHAPCMTLQPHPVVPVPDEE